MLPVDRGRRNHRISQAGTVVLYNRLKQLGRDSVIYGFGGAMAKLVGFATLPIYARIFLPAEYGTIEMLTVVCSLLSTVIIAGTDSAQSFYFFQEKDNEETSQARVVAGVLQWRLISGIIVVGAVTLMSPLLNTGVFGGLLKPVHFAVAFGGAFGIVIMNQAAEVFRLLYRPWPYLLITLGYSVVSAIVTLVLVLVFDYGILGYFIGILAASVVIAIAAWFALRGRADVFRLQSPWWPRLLRFGIPLVPAGLGMYAMNTTDRWMVNFYHGPELLAVYGVGARIAMMITLFTQTFRMAWLPIGMDAMHSDDGPDTFRTIARLFMGIGTSAAVYVSFLSPWLCTWIGGEAYSQAYPIVAALAWQAIFYGFYTIASAGIWKAEKTAYAPILMIGAALLNLLLNYLWVPKYGGIGAAVSTIIVFFLWVSATLIVSERLWRIHLPIGILLGQVIVGATCALTIVYLHGSGHGFALIAILAHCGTILLFLSGLDKGVWHHIYAWIKQQRS